MYFYGVFRLNYFCFPAVSRLFWGNFGAILEQFYKLLFIYAQIVDFFRATRRKKNVILWRTSLTKSVNQPPGHKKTRREQMHRVFRL